MQDAKKKQEGDIAAAAGALLTRAQAARALGISKGMLSTWTRLGCPVVYLGRKCQYETGSRPRWILEQVHEWLAAGRKPTGGKEVDA